MCGIAGYISDDLPRRAAMDDGIASAIRYRGRDAEGEWSDNRRVRLFHARLSIVALGDGAQPMADVGDRYVIVFNGEIYNYIELRAEYRRLGASFSTNSDTEVVLEGYKLKGSAVCNDLNGMFAFAIWDRKAGILFLARDRLGKKPLYWVTLNGRFFFASTIDAFLGVPGWSGCLSASTIGLYGRLGCFPDHLTVYEQVRALPPAHYAAVRPGEAVPNLGRYWSLSFPSRRVRDFEEAAEKYKALLQDAIRIRLRADVPLALSFSGGVDSGTIAAIAAKELNASLKCYTIDYDTDADRSEETAIARSVASKLGLEWHYIQYDYPNDLFADVADAMRTFDQPCSQMPMAYSLRLYREMRKYAKVVLSGAGSDELFTGYVGNEALFQRDLAESRQRYLGALCRRILPRRIGDELAKYFPGPLSLSKSQTDYLRVSSKGDEVDDAAEQYVEALFREILASGVATHLDLNQFMSLRYFGAAANFILPDITGLRAQVEVRSPYLDHRMVEFAAELPGAFKVADGNDSGTVKYLPKKVYSRYVGEEIAWASKKGMAMNVRFYENFVRDPECHNHVTRVLGRIGEFGLDGREFSVAWRSYIEDLRKGAIGSPFAGVAVGGLMLGNWLARKPLCIERTLKQ